MLSYNMSPDRNKSVTADFCREHYFHGHIQCVYQSDDPNNHIEDIQSSFP
jgi:hypothetical protein